MTWTRDWVPHSTKTWPQKARELGMMFMYELALDMSWNVSLDGVKRDEGLRTILEVKTLLTEIMGPEGEVWYCRDPEWKLNRLDLYTLNEDWTTHAALLATIEAKRTLDRVRLVVERQASW